MTPAEIHAYIVERMPEAVTGFEADVVQPAILVDRDQQFAPAGGGEVDLDVAVPAEAVAYMIYTSGSTGMFPMQRNGLPSAETMRTSRSSGPGAPTRGSPCARGRCCCSRTVWRGCRAACRWRAGAAAATRALSRPRVVRRGMRWLASLVLVVGDRPPLGASLPEHADTRNRHALPRPVPGRSHHTVRGARHDPTVRALRRAVSRSVRADGAPRRTRASPSWATRGRSSAVQGSSATFRAEGRCSRSASSSPSSPSVAPMPPGSPVPAPTIDDAEV